MGLEIRVELTGPLEEHVLHEMEAGSGYADVSAYVRDLIRRDMAAVDAHQFRTVKEHLDEAFAAPESDYVELEAAQFLADMKSGRG